MSIFARWLAPFNLGRGMMKFHQKKYIESIAILKKVKESDPNSDKIGIYASYIGRAMYAINSKKEAHQELKEAYTYFQDRKFRSHDETERDLIVDTLKAYSAVLKEIGDNDLATKVVEDLGAVS